MATGVELGNYEEIIRTSAPSDKEVVFLFLLFFIDEDHKGRYMISESCQTRLKNIKNISWYDGNKYKAFSIPIQSIDEIIGQIPKIILRHSEGDTKKVVVAEMGFFSHAAGDGPISYNKKVIICPEPKYESQMLTCGWEQIIIEWALNSKCVFYGCNTGSKDSLRYKNFAQNISNLPNFKDVEIWGQSTSSFPSFYPDYRVTTIARSLGDNGSGWDVAETYQVSGNTGEGKKAMSYTGYEKTPEELKDFPKANPMNYYKNGTLIKSTHQGVFNDHR